MPTNRLQDTLIRRRAGNNKAYILERLQRDRPDLFSKVQAGTMSAYRAAIEAGFRKKHTHFGKIIKLLPALTGDELDDLVLEIQFAREHKR